MKRHGNLWGKVCDKSNVELAFDNVLKQKHGTSKVCWIINNKPALIEEVTNSLINETYVFSELESFVVFEPKERRIHHSPMYPDKILHHCVMNVILPLFMSKFTSDTYGSIKGRGVTSCANKLKSVLRHNPISYYVQVDCRKFYQSIDHDAMKAQVRRVIKCTKTLRMLDAIIDTHSEGLAIGVYPSQYLGNLMLSPIDHWAKEVLRVKHYFRYMDDIVMVVPDKASAWVALNGVTEEIAKLKLEVKNSARIAPVYTGIDFVGYKFYPTHTLLRKRIKMRMQRTVRKLIKRNASDELFKQKTASHFGWCKHANCRNLMRTTFKTKYELYRSKMEFKRLSEKKEAENWFSLPRDARLSIEDLMDKDIAILDFTNAKIRGEDKVVVKFVFPEMSESQHYFITRSEVIKDRLERDKEHLPFVVTLKKVKGYFAYE